MLSKVRLEANGVTAAEVENILYSHAGEIEKLLGIPTSRGECVIQRNLGEGDSPFAFSGRLLLHPDISTGFTITANTSGAAVAYGGTATFAG